MDIIRYLILQEGSDFIQISAGEEHSVALRENGTLVSWEHFDLIENALMFLNRKSSYYKYSHLMENIEGKITYLKLHNKWNEKSGSQCTVLIRNCSKHVINTLVTENKINDSSQGVQSERIGEGKSRLFSVKPGAEYVYVGIYSFQDGIQNKPVYVLYHRFPVNSDISFHHE